MTNNLSTEIPPTIVSAGVVASEGDHILTVTFDIDVLQDSVDGTFISGANSFTIDSITNNVIKYNVVPDFFSDNNYTFTYLENNVLSNLRNASDDAELETVFSYPIDNQLVTGATVVSATVSTPANEIVVVFSTNVFETDTSGISFTGKSTPVIENIIWRYYNL